MARFKVTTPAGKLTTKIVGVNFADGVAEVDSVADRRALEYFRRSGYKVEEIGDDEEEPVKLTSAEKRAKAAAEKKAADEAKAAEEAAAKAAAEAAAAAGNGGTK